MEYLKNKLLEDLIDIEQEIEKRGDFTEKELNHIYRLTKTYCYLDKISEAVKKHSSYSSRSYDNTNSFSHL